LWLALQPVPPRSCNMRDLGYISTYYIPDPIAGEEGENDKKPIGYHGEKKETKEEQQKTRKGGGFDTNRVF
jgi:hypothetical protein